MRADKNNGLILLLLLGVIGFFSFKKPKKKGTVIISPLQDDNLYALPNTHLYDENYIPIYTFNNKTLLELLNDTGFNYQVRFVAPGGIDLTGFIDYKDATNG